MSDPYYSDESVTLWHGDCLDIDAWLAADVLITDPPYGIAYKSNFRRVDLADSIRGDADTSFRDAALSAFGKANGGDVRYRPAAVFGSWQRPRPEFTRMRLIWDTKGALGMGDTTMPWKPASQEIYILGRGWHGRRGTDVITCAPVQSLGYNGRLHPHQKPVELMEHLIERAPAGVIADPFCGSGSTLVAAKNQGRKVIGVEADERYLEVIAKRLDQGVLNFGSAS